MKRILNALAFISFGLLSANASADDINFLLSNRVDIAQGSGRPQVLFIIDVLEASSVARETTTDNSTTPRTVTAGAEGCLDVPTEMPSEMIQFLVPVQIKFKGKFCANNDGYVAVDVSEISVDKYDEIVTKDPREIVKYIMRTRPDLEYGVISLNSYSEPDSYLTSAELKLEVDHRADVASAFGVIQGITSHSDKSTPIMGGLSVAYDYLSGQLDDGSNSGTSYTSPLDNSCNDVKLILITNGGWTNDIDHAATTGLRTAVTTQLGNTNSTSAYLQKITEYIRNYQVKANCTARVSTSVYGIDAPDTELMFAGAEPVGKLMADVGNGNFLNAGTGGEIVRSILEDLDHSYPDPLSLSSPSVAIAVNRAAHKPTAFATAFEPLKTQRWYGNITDKDLSDSTDTTLDPVGSEAAGAKTFANGFIATKTAVSRVIKTNINSTTLRDLSGIVGTAETIISSDDYSEFVKDLPGGLADSIHFKPLAIDYGGSIGTRLVIGTNDGLLHMFDSSGNELWAFLPKEMETLVPALVNGNTAPNYMMVDHFYGVDGAPTAFVYDAPDNDGLRDGAITSVDGSKDKVFIYFGLRRGGGSYYAMDITDPTTPSILWTKGSMNIDYGAKFDIDISDSEIKNEGTDTQVLDASVGGKGCPVFGLFNLSDAKSYAISDNVSDKLRQKVNGTWVTGNEQLFGINSYGYQEPSSSAYFYYKNANDYGYTLKNQCLMDLSSTTKFTFDAHPWAMYAYNVTDPDKNSTCSSTTYLSNVNGMFVGKDGANSPAEAIVGFDITSIPSNAYITSAQLTLAHEPTAVSGFSNKESKIYNAKLAIHAVNGYFGNDPGRNAHSTQNCTDKDVYNGDNGYKVYQYVGGVEDPGSPYEVGERSIDGVIYPEDLYGSFYTNTEMNAKGIKALSKLFKHDVLHDSRHEIAWIQFKVQIVKDSDIASGDISRFGSPVAGPQVVNWKNGDDYWNKVVPKLTVTWTTTEPIETITDAEMELTKDEFWAVRGSGTLGGESSGSGGACAATSSVGSKDHHDAGRVTCNTTTGACTDSEATSLLSYFAPNAYVLYEYDNNWYLTSAACEAANSGVTTYTVTITDGSNGTVSTNSKTVNTGETTSFTITPDTDYEAAVNSGCGGSLTDGTYTTGAVSADCSISVSFSAVSASTYSLNVGISGSGTVTGTGIDCGTDCTESYADGASVTLSATADTGYQFDSWSGACSGSGTCSVTMNSNQNITATFEAISAGSSCEAISPTKRCTRLFYPYPDGLDDAHKDITSLTNCTAEDSNPGGSTGWLTFTCEGSITGESCIFKYGKSSGTVNSTYGYTDDIYTHQKDNKYYKSEATCQAAP